jgi:hypothetical protein
MRILIMFAVAACVTGCQQYKAAEAKKELTEAIKVCKHGEPLIPQNAIARVDCMSTAQVQYFIATDSPALGILEQVMAEDRESAVQYSEGKISQQDFVTAAKMHWAQGTQAAAAMGQQRAQNATNALAAYGALQSAMPHPAPVQPYMMPVNRPVQTNCMGNGNAINCTSY